MKYETPELTALTPAINAIQTPVSEKGHLAFPDSPMNDEDVASYADWE
jgi:hypothetical protein